MKSDTLAKIDKFKNKCDRALDRLQRKCLVALYEQIMPEQKDVFNRMYGSVDGIKADKIRWAIQQLENTLETNAVRKVEGLLGIEKKK